MKTKRIRKHAAKSKAGSAADTAPATQTACPYHAASLLLCCCRVVDGRRPGTVGVIKVGDLVRKVNAA